MIQLCVFFMLSYSRMHCPQSFAMLGTSGLLCTSTDRHLISFWHCEGTEFPVPNEPPEPTYSEGGEEDMQLAVPPRPAPTQYTVVSTIPVLTQQDVYPTGTGTTVDGDGDCEWLGCQPSSSSDPDPFLPSQAGRRMSMWRTNGHSYELVDKSYGAL